MGRILQLVEECNWYRARFIQYLDKDHQEGLVVVLEYGMEPGRRRARTFSSRGLTTSSWGGTTR